jgi:hypothetical protein
MQNNILLDNGSVSMFPWQRINTLSDELFEMVIYIRFTSKLQREATVSSSSVHHRVQKRSAPVKKRDSPADKNKNTRCLFVCNRFVK